jgi:hypothetical protein
MITGPFGGFTALAVVDRRAQRHHISSGIAMSGMRVMGLCRAGIAAIQPGDGQFIFRPRPKGGEAVLGRGAVVIDADRCRPRDAAVG